jgi:hypothetical protein
MFLTPCFRNSSANGKIRPHRCFRGIASCSMMLLNNMVLSPATTLVVYLLNYDSDFLKVAKLARPTGRHTAFL